MNINYIKSSSLSELLKIKFDIIICSSGFEKRASFLIEKNKFESDMKICFGFKANKQLSRDSNDKLFINKDFKIIEVDNNSDLEITSIIENFLSVKNQSKEIKILVDYSSMSTLMYSSILKYFNDTNNYNKVTILFSYTQALFTEPINKKSLKYNNPIPIFHNI